MSNENVTQRVVGRQHLFMRGVSVRSLVLLAASGCFNPPAAPPDAPDAPYGYDGPEGEDAFDAPIEFRPWGAVTVVLPAMGDDDPTLTEDMLELYFNRNSDIYVATRATVADPFGTPALVSELSTSFAETTPEVSANGLTIYFASRNTPTLGVEDIWMATRLSRSDPWSAPVHVTELSSTAFDGAPTPTVDDIGLVMYSDRSGSLEIYESTRQFPSDPWNAPVVHAELTTGSGELDPMLSPDRLTIYYDSAASNGGDLYVARRASPMASFFTPAPIAELNTPLALEEDPWVSPDGRHMFFASNRTGTEGIYEASR
jgi:hypothetical protein